jgi:hypothetical protein
VVEAPPVRAIFLAGDSKLTLHQQPTPSRLVVLIHTLRELGEEALLPA